MLRRHLGFILACTLICVVASIIYLIIQKPVYEATATLRIDPARASSLGVSDNPLGSAVDPTSLISTEIAVLEGDGVARRTLATLPSGTHLSYVQNPQETLPLSERAQSLNAQQQQILDDFKLNVSAKQIEGTQLIAVNFRDQNPDVAATVVNQLVQAYEVETFQDRDNSVSQLRTWLSNEMAALRAQVETSQKKLAAFQEANNIIGTPGTSTTVSDRLRLLNDSLAAAQATRITKEAELRAARAGDPATLSALFPNPHLEALQKEQATLLARAGELSAKFGSRYPPLLEVNRELQQLNMEISADLTSVQRRLKQEFDAAQATQNMLQNEYDKQTQLAYSLNRNQAEYAVLQAEVASSKDLYDTLRRKLQQASVDAEVNGLATILVDSARTPTKPVLPKKWLILGASILLGLFAGSTAALLREANSDHLLNGTQLRDASPYQTLAVISRDRGANGKGKFGRATSSDPLVTLRAPSSTAAEGYRALRNAVLLSGHAPKTLLMTSSGMEEGVQTVAANYAVVLAQAGFSVLLVDADLLNPTLHNEFNVANEAGLSDYLAGPVSAHPRAYPIEGVKGLHLVPAGAGAESVSSTSVWHRLQPTLQRWASEYDYVVLQAAPVAMVSDTLLLATWASGVVLVTRYNTTKIGALEKLMESLRKTTSTVLGVVVCDVPNAIIDSSF